MILPVDMRLAWFDFLVSQHPHATVIVDQDRIIRYANAAAAALSGRATPDELLGLAYPALVAEYRVLNEDGSYLKPEDFPSDQALRSGIETRGKVLALIHKDGSHAWLSISSFPLRNEKGVIEHAGIVFEIISERKLHEDRLKFLVESEKILSLTSDLRTRLIEKARILVPSLADWATVNVLDDDGLLSRVAVVHRDPEKIPLVTKLAEHAEQNPQRGSGIRTVVETGRPQLHPDVRSGGFVPQDPELRKAWEALQPTSSIIVPLVSRGRVLGVLSLAYAESRRTYTQDDMEFMQEFGHHLGITIDNSRLYAEIEKRDQMKDRFLATLSHELRNPLGPIKHSLELLRMNLGEKGKDELAIVEHHFNHMTKLIKDLLDVTRYTHSRLKIDRAPVELLPLIEFAIATQRPFLDKKGLTLSFSRPSDELWVMGDPLRLEQALINLLHNAEKFTPAGGSVRVEVSKEGESARIVVSDTGVGIHHEDMGRIFEAYFQGERRHSLASEGLGMGLVLVKEIVSLHEGTITAASAGPGLGTTFTITLPLTDAPAERTESPPSSVSIDTSTMRILVVDDNTSAADALARLLSAAGFDSKTAYSGEEGIETFSPYEPDAVVMDIGMPGMDGYETIRRMRERFGPDFRAIALSGYGFSEDKKKAVEAGFDTHLTKPVGLKELMAALEGFRGP